MAFANFSFAAPAEPDPTYVPDFRVLRDVGDSILPLFGEDDGTIPDGTGQQLLEGCMERNWVLTDHLIRLLETAWRIKQAQDDVKKAVNTQDEKTGFTPAYLCVRENKPAFAEKLANLGADLNVRIRDGSTALHFAAANLKEDVVRLLITVGSDASLQGGPLNQLPLHVACARKHGAFPVVQYLVYLSGEYARLMMDAQGETALWRATEACHFHLVKELLKEQAAAQLSYQNKVQNGDTVMHSALRRGQTDFLKVFIDTGASVNIQNFDGQTLLHIAVQNVNKAAITLLHEHNANAELVDKYERTPLHLAVERGLDDVVNMLTELYSGSIHIRTKDGSTLAHIASLSGHPETVLTLLKRGVYLHMPNKTGALALHAAARTAEALSSLQNIGKKRERPLPVAGENPEGHSSVVKALLMKGSKVDAKTRSNYTALHLAIEYAKSSVVEVLLGAGASVHTKGGKNLETPLHIAARIPNGERCAELLLKCGAAVNARMENGESPLHVAARLGSMKMVQILLKDGADPVATSAAAETPFHVAVRACHFEIAKHLLEFVTRKWDRYDAVNLVNSANSEGETALHFVTEISPDVMHDEAEDVKLLHYVLEYNADPGAQTKLTLETPLHYAARAGNDQVLSALLNSISTTAVQHVINRQSRTGWSPLMTACEGGHLNVVKMLIKKHARVDVYDEAGKASLHIAAENGHLDIVEYLLRNSAFVNTKNKLGITPLHLAAMKGWTDIASLLVGKYEATVDSFSNAMRTPLHLAAQHGKLDVCELLLRMGANPLATDDNGQTALHIAAECDNEAIVQLFLRVLSDKNPLKLADSRGNTVAHIAAKNGSVAVIQLLLRFDKNDIITSKTSWNNSTVLHIAAEGGHAELVKILLEAAASPAVENNDGNTPILLAARHGHLEVLDVLREKFSPKISSMKHGLSALHIASYYGQADAVRELLASVPATIRSDEPTVTTATGYELGAEGGLTPLHLACRNGHESVVRMLLNYPGVLVDAPTDKTAYLPLHFAAVEGQVAVVGSLLSRAGSQLNTPDAKGQTSLLLAAAKGHKHMAEVLLGQGADMAAKDNNGWTALHCASVTGNLEMVTLLCENGGDTVAVTNDGKIPLCYAVHAVHANHGFRGTGLIDVMEYLLQQNFSSFSLMTDQVFLMDLMHAAKNKSQKPLFVFIKYCSSPVELSLKLSRFYLDTAERDKFNAKDLIFAAKFCEQIGQRLLTISCAKYSAAEVLRAIDKDDVPLMDTLMAGSHKETVALNPVQRYLTTIWYGGVELKQWQVILTFLTVLFLPPVWLVCSLPLPHRISEIPFVKMVVHFTSHMYYIIIMILVFMTPFRPLYLRTSLLPTPEEWLLILWLIGNLMSELSTQEKRQGLDSLRIVTLFLAGVAVTVHIAAAGVDKETRVILLYIRSQLLATACFFADIQILSYLSFHQLFGPFGIMISDIVVDLARFWVLFSLFWLGFSFSLSTLYEAYIPADPAKVYDGAIIMNMVVDPFTAAQLLYWAIFGLIDPFGQIPKPELSPPFALQVILIIYGIYLTATMIVLVNLLIAMLSDTYQRVKARSDLEWRFIRARIILNMEKTPISPPPINIFSVLLSGALKLFEMCFNRRSNSVANSEELLMQKEGQQVNKLRSFRKSVIGGISAGSLPLIVSLRNAPAKQLTEVVPWKNVLRDYEAEIALGYEDFDDV